MPARRGMILRRFVIACGVLASIFFACYLALDSSVRRMEHNVRAEVRASDTPTDVSALLEASRSRSSIGKIVFLHEVRIEAGPTKNLLFARDQQGNRIVVHWDGAAIRLLNDKLADVTGVITPLPSHATMVREWKLSKSVAADMGKEAVYIRADRIWPATPAYTRESER